jgi:SAM-dependent methyltransferase
VTPIGAEGPDGSPPGSHDPQATDSADGATGKRRRWEDQWQRHRGAEFHWYLSEPPPELVRLVEDGRIPLGGAALDLGCGPGVATSYLAASFHPAVGLDIAQGAVVEARSRARGENRDPSFLVAEAPVLPFRTGAFSFVFDRGCLQAIPRQAWERYFREVDRVLAPGGMLQLYVSKAARQFPPLLSGRGIRLRLRWLRGKRGGPRFLSPGLIRQLHPASLKEIELRQFPFRTKADTVRTVTYGLFRKD